MFELRPCGNLHALPRFGIYGRGYARAVYGGLREIVPENGHPLGQYVDEAATGTGGASDPDSGPGWRSADGFSRNDKLSLVRSREREGLRVSNHSAIGWGGFGYESYVPHSQNVSEDENGIRPS